MKKLKLSYGVIKQFTCQAANISCKNLNSRSGLAVISQDQHSTAVSTAISVNNATWDQATTCNSFLSNP